jgi:ceramide glucosyltransferase
MPIVAIPFLLLALAGIGYTLAAAILAGRFDRAPRTGPVTAEAVTLLKPLHGAEPRLAENLAGFLDQEWDAPIEMVVGVQRVDDPALLAVPMGDNGRGPGDLGGAGGGPLPVRRIRRVIDPTPHGANRKVANLINMMSAQSHDLIVLSDSDMTVPRDYLATLAGALAEPGVGAVTCVYRGRGDCGRWSELAAAGISYHFIPQLLIGLALGLARPGMGSTIALRRSTLDAVGGFGRFADTLADDYELGEAVRALGLTVVVPPMILVHGCTERSLGEVWRHELRWSATILAINPGGHLGTIVTYPVPMALLALPFNPLAGSLMLAVALAARLFMVEKVDRLTGASSGRRRWLPLRDCLSFGVFIASFFVRSVDWRGARLKMDRDGRRIQAQGVESL